MGDLEKLERQLKIEKEAVDYSYDRLVKEISKRVDNNQADDLKEGQIILLHSVGLVEHKIKEFFVSKDIRSTRKAIQLELSAEFNNDEKTLALIVITTLVRSVSKNLHVPIPTVIRDIASSIATSIRIRKLEDKSKLNNYLEEKYKKRGKRYVNSVKQQVSSKYEKLETDVLTKFSTLLGATMVDIVIKSGADIIREVNISKKEGKSFKVVKHITYTDECYRMILQSRKQLLSSYQKYPILIMPPRDYTEFEGSGGYYSTQYYKVPLVKTHGANTKILREYFNKGYVSDVYSVINTIQQTAWRVNKRVYDVMSYIFDHNIEAANSSRNNPYLVGGLPYNGFLDAREMLDIRKYGELETEGYKKGLPKDKQMLRKFFDDLTVQEDIINSNNGRAIMLGLVLYNAKEYINEPEIYFSYQYDFRGRLYPIQQHLQPQGDSVTKALLEFTESCPIETKEEEFWFYVHGANCYGYDKDSYEERVRKIKEKIEEIKLIASDPLRYREYWHDTDSPYLYLAWCFELNDYLSNPTNFRSHLPIALDATCSGIQIYSGLLLDADGAAAVNVTGDVRNDIYQKVADKAQEYLDNGDYNREYTFKTSDGEEHSKNTSGVVKDLSGNITRGLTKRNTMTQPYSVTKRGMYEQLKGELFDLEINNKRFWSSETWFVAKFLADLNDRAITDVVKGARSGQEYLKAVTRDVVKNGKYVFYTTYLGFPVLQRIFRTTVERITTPIGKLSVLTTTNSIHKLRMENGIAPNKIHSLDGGGGLLGITVLRMSAKNVKSFHLIHDSYGVLVRDIPILNTEVREAFIELFSSNPLAKFVSQVNPNYEVKAEDVMINTLNLEDVREAKYIFS